MTNLNAIPDWCLQQRQSVKKKRAGRRDTVYYVDHKELAGIIDKVMRDVIYLMKLVLRGLSSSGCPSSLTFSLRIIQAMLRPSVRMV